MNPACGPPTSLSPLNVTRSAPSASRSAGIGSWASPNAAVSSSAPLPEVVDDERAVPMRGRGERRRVGRLDEPVLAEVRRVDPQDQPRPAVGERRLEVGDAGPVRRPDLDQLRARAPHDLRDPDAAADLDQLAAAHRDAAATRQPARRARRPRRCSSTMSASSAPVSAMRCSSASRIAAAAPAGRAVELEERASRPRPRRPPRSRRRGHGARPRFVWTMTPVALIDRASGPAAVSNAASRVGDVRGQRLRPTPARRPRGEAARSSSTTARATASTAPAIPLAGDGRAAASTRSTLTAAATPAWSSILRGLAGAHGSRTHRATPSAAPPVLKTGEPTGTPPLPRPMVRGRFAVPAYACRLRRPGVVAAVLRRRRPGARPLA